jgi:hypothetical protein
VVFGWVGGGGDVFLYYKFLTIRIGSNRNNSRQIAASIIGRKFKLRPIVATIIGRKFHHRNGPMIATPDYKQF